MLVFTWGGAVYVGKSGLRGEPAPPRKQGVSDPTPPRKQGVSDRSRGVVPPSEPTPESRFAQTMKQLLSRLGALSVILCEASPATLATLRSCDPSILRSWSRYRMLFFK